MLSQSIKCELRNSQSYKYSVTSLFHMSNVINSLKNELFITSNTTIDELLVMIDFIQQDKMRLYNSKLSGMKRDGSEDDVFC